MPFLQGHFSPASGKNTTVGVIGNLVETGEDRDAGEGHTKVQGADQGQQASSSPHTSDLDPGIIDP